MTLITAMWLGMIAGIVLLTTLLASYHAGHNVGYRRGRDKAKLEITDRLNNVWRGLGAKDADVQ